MDAGLPRGEHRALVGAVCALCAIALVTIWSVDYLPTHDGPQHIFTVHAKQHLGDPSNGYARWLEVGHPITAHGFAPVFGPFDRWLPWRTAYRASLSVMLLGWILGAVAFARSLDSRRAWLGVALAAASFQWSLYMGLFSFYIATAFGLWVLAYVASRRRWSTRERVIAGGLLLAQALFHVFPALLTAAAASALVGSRTPPVRRPREALAMSLALLPTLAIAAAVALGSAQQTQLLGRSSEAWTYQWPGLWTLGKAMTGGPAWRAWAPTLLAIVLSAVALGRFRDRLRPGDWMLLLAGGTGLVCAITLPLHLAGWDFFSVRFLPFALTCLLLAFPLEALTPRTRRGFAGGCVALAIASHLWALDYNRELDRRSAPALRGLETTVARSGPRLAVVMDPYLGRPLDDREAPMPFVVPLLNLGQLYATEQGGLPADTFAISPTTHQVLIRSDAPPFPPYPDRSFAIALRKDPSPELRRKLTAYVASYAAGFEDVILFGQAHDGERLLERGFEATYRADGLLLARFRGCPLAVEVDDVRHPSAADTRIELGWYPLLEVAQQHVLSADAATRLDFDRAPCGPVWLRVTRTSASPTEREAPRTCRGADASGRLVLRDSRATPVVRCDLGTS